MNQRIRRILIEELIRAMAIFGVLAFGAVPIAHHGIGIRADIVLLGALALSVASFPVMVLLRLKTGREFKVTSRRGWIVAGTVYVISLFAISTVLFIFKDGSSRRWVQLLVDILLVGAFTWRAIRAGRSASKDDFGDSDTMCQ